MFSLSEPPLSLKNPASPRPPGAPSPRAASLRRRSRCFWSNWWPGLGLVMVSPWSNQGASASTLSVAGGIGLILMAVMASALGGYIAGRLRTRWVGIKTDEVYFRDTAHGLLAWAVGTIILATVLASAAGTIVTSVTQGAASNPALVPDRNSYYVDSLFSSDRPAPPNAAGAEQTNAEASRLFTRALTPGTEFTGNDRTRMRATGGGAHRAVAAGSRAARRPGDHAGEGCGRSGAQGRVQDGVLDGGFAARRRACGIARRDRRRARTRRLSGHHGETPGRAPGGLSAWLLVRARPQNARSPGLAAGASLFSTAFATRAFGQRQIAHQRQTRVSARTARAE